MRTGRRFESFARLDSEAAVDVELSVSESLPTGKPLPELRCVVLKLAVPTFCLSLVARWREWDIVTETTAFADAA